MSIKKRRDSLLKSSISINSIRNSVSNFTKGLISSRETASEIVKRTNENNKFKRTLIGKDNSFFAKRRENARRRQREDELEASTVQGTTKRQGNVVSRSTKGFLGRILDFFGIVLIGWFVNTLPSILKSIQGLIKRIQGLITILTNFMDSIGDFLVSIGMGISGAIQKLSSGIDLALLRRQNEESLESANNNMNKVRKDMLTTGILYNNPANAGLDDFSGETLIPTPLDDAVDDKKEDDEKPQDQKSTSDKNVEGREDEKNTQNFDSVNQRNSETKPQKDDDPNNQNFIQGIQDDKEVKQEKSDEAQSKGETIDERNDVNDLDKNKKNDDAGIVSGVKNFMASFLGGEGQQQANKQKLESNDKKDNSSILSGFKANLEKLKTLDIANANTKDKSSLVEPPKRNRDNLKTKNNKNRSQVVIIEKGVPTGSSSAPSSGGGGGGSSLNSLSGLQDSDAMKNGIKKLQSVILAN
jgi:hypothetical protein